MVVPRCIHLAISALTLCACAGSIERAFDRRGYDDPVETTGAIVEPNVGTWGGTCSYASDRKIEIARLMALATRAQLEKLARLHCSDAEGVVISEPFLFAESPRDGGREGLLALHVRCFGTGRVRGMDLSTMSDREINRDIEVASQLDNWLFSSGDNYWFLENILLFEAKNERVEFLRVLETWDESDEIPRLNRMMIQGINTDFHHPLAGKLGCCGRIHADDVCVPLSTD